MSIHPLGHHELALLLFQLAILLIVARACGELCRRFNIPTVVGELSAGVLLGPSVLGALFPTLKQALFPASQTMSDLLAVVTWLGVLFLLLATGLETDLALIRRMGRKAVMISAGGIIVPFLSGLGLAYALPAAFLTSPGHRTGFALFVATAMSISAIPVIARILMELKIIRRDIGQLTLAAGMIDDTVGWILLSVVAGLASAGTLDLWIPVRSILAVGAVLLVSFTIGRRVIAALYRWVDDHLGGSGALVSLTGVLVFLAAATTLELGLEAVLGAFIVGLVLREAPRYRPETTHSIEEFTRLLLSPIFFAAAGLKVNLTAFIDPVLLGWALVVLAVACVGKFVGVLLGGRAAGLTRWEGFAIGAGMNARGAMEIIVATIGLSLGVLTTDMYSIIVFVAIATSLMAPPLLRIFVSRIVIQEDEARRLELEERERTSFLAGLRRILLPTRGGGNARFATSLLRRTLEGRSVDVTVLYLNETPNRLKFWQRIGRAPGQAESAIRAATAALAPLAVRPVTLDTEGRDAARLIAQQSRDHDLITLGASETQDRWRRGYTFGPVIDEVLVSVDCPVLVVRAPGTELISLGVEFEAPLIRRILVPTTGTTASRAAIDLGLTLARAHDADCVFLFVEEAGGADDEEPSESMAALRGHPLAMGGQQKTLTGDEEDLRVELRTVRAPMAGAAIVGAAVEGSFDLIVLNALLRPGARGAYLGPQVDYVLRRSSCPVAVLVGR